MINEQRLLDEFLELVQIDSLSRDEANVAKVLIKKLEDLGLEVYVDNAGEKIGGNTGNVIAKFKGNVDNIPTILFSSHMDTVVPGKGIKPVIKDGVVHSDGTTILGSDDKAGIAAILEAIRYIQENNIDHGDVEVVLTIAEEGGLFGAKNVEYDKLKATMGFVLDSGGAPGEIILKGPAQDKVNATIYGKPAHAGVAPEQGISAIQVAAHAIDNMKLLRIDSETTANIGTISGGTATNIVCDKVEIKAESRSLDNAKLDIQTQHMVDTFKMAAEKFGAKVDVQTERMYSAFNVDENDAIVAIVKGAAQRLGLTPVLASTGGGSDTNIFNANGVKSINLGVGMTKPHTLEEHIKIVDLVDSARLVAEIIKSVK